MMPGGLSPTEPATPEVQAIASQTKGQLEAKVNQNYSTFEAIAYRSQVVAGTNFFIKVRVGDGESDYVHLQVFRPLSGAGGQVELVGYQLHKTREDPITSFYNMEQ